MNSCIWLEVAAERKRNELMFGRLSAVMASPIAPAVERRTLVVILVFAALLRLALAPVVHARLGYLPDVLSYRTAAAQLWALSLIKDPWVMPGYPLLVMLAGRGGFGQLLADTAVSVVGVWCLARITREISGNPLAALLAALMWAVYPFAIFYTVVGLSENLFLTLFLLGFLGYLLSRFTWGSIAMVAAILTRPTTELLTPILLIVFVLLVHHLSLRQAAKHLGIFAAIYVVLMAPWWWHNYEKYGEFVRLDLASGLVLYSGNNPRNTDGGGVNVKITVPGYHETSDPVARDRILRQAAVRYIIDNPGRFLKLAAIKFTRLWRPWPYAREYSSGLLAVTAATAYLPVLALAVAGGVGGLRRRDVRLLPIALYIGYVTAIHMVTIGSLRYRFPMEPFLVILAAAPLAWIVRHLLPAPATGRAAQGAP